MGCAPPTTHQTKRDRTHANCHYVIIRVVYTTLSLSLKCQKVVVGIPCQASPGHTTHTEHASCVLYTPSLVFFFFREINDIQTDTLIDIQTHRHPDIRTDKLPDSLLLREITGEKESKDIHASVRWGSMEF